MRAVARRLIASSLAPPRTISGMAPWPAARTRSTGRLRSDGGSIVRFRLSDEALWTSEFTADDASGLTRKLRRRWTYGSIQASAPNRKDSRELVRGDDIQLGIGAVVRLLVAAPAPELRRMAEAVPLHMLVRDLDDELRP